MSQSIKKTNYWNKKIQYIGLSAAQSILKVPVLATSKNIQMSAADCSCSCHGDCSGGDCSSCSYDNS